MRKRYIQINGELVEMTGEVGARQRPFHSIHTDSMDPIIDHSTGTMVDSKSKYYRNLRATGCHIVEKGETPYKERPQPTGIKQDIINSIRRVNGY